MSLWGYDNYLHSFFLLSSGRNIWAPCALAAIVPMQSNGVCFLGKSASCVSVCVCVSLRVVVVGMCVFIEDKAWLMREGDRHFWHCRMLVHGWADTHHPHSLSSPSVNTHTHTHIYKSLLIYIMLLCVSQKPLLFACVDCSFTTPIPMSSVWSKRFSHLRPPSTLSIPSSLCWAGVSHSYWIKRF